MSLQEEKFPSTIKKLKFFPIIKKIILEGKNINIIFQDNNLLTDFTALENVMMPLIIRGESKKISQEKAKNF